GPQLVTLIIPEGFSLAQIAARVGTIPGHSAAGFLAEAMSGQVTSPYGPSGTDDLEGLLFPATYTVAPGATDEKILQMMVDAFDTRASSAGITQAAAKLGISPYEAVIVASLVIKEAKLPADMGKVARVVYNRLADGMPLQIDETVIYAAGGDPNALSGKSPAEVEPNSPYNTYNVKGLPPTPIASPGMAALDAALSPTPGNWLYYVVVSPDGAEAFCATYACQQANVAKATSQGLLN
ncbi:MAG: endolytic transglycosylase MltG, partial [Acidimicrobiales bacterium]